MNRWWSWAVGRKERREGRWARKKEEGKGCARGILYSQKKTEEERKEKDRAREERKGDFAKIF